MRESRCIACDQRLEGAQLLEAIEAVWSDHCTQVDSIARLLLWQHSLIGLLALQMLTVRGVFLYLDRTYVIQTSANSQQALRVASLPRMRCLICPVQPRSLWDMGLHVFCGHFTGRAAHARTRFVAQFAAENAALLNAVVMDLIGLVEKVG